VTTDISDVAKLFQEASERGGFEYLYTLVKIDGIQLHPAYKDELVALRDWLRQPSTNDPIESYRYFLSQTQGLELLQNLVYCASGKPYQIRAFYPLVKGQYPNAIWPTLQEKVASLVTDVKALGLGRLADAILASYPPAIFADTELTLEIVGPAHIAIVDLLKEFLDCYFSERLKFKGQPQYIKLPKSLDVLELIVDDEFGLSGLRVHFSQNCTADFWRTPKGVFGTNLEFGPPVTFLMMSMAPSSNEYRVDGKRLYEVGMPGRYNRLGEWKPLIYPGNPQHLVAECKELSADPDVQGVLLYLRLTGHRCIEFALRTNLELPGVYTSTKEGGVYLWKCPADDSRKVNENVTVYDCWIELKGTDVADIERGLLSIGHLISILCFPFGASYSWRVKYRMNVGALGKLTPTEEELRLVDKVLEEFPYTVDGNILASAIDWYNRGTMSPNIFTSFFCYYVALESVAVAIADGAQLGATHLSKVGKAVRKELAISCIQEKHSELFSLDPVAFVERSYFDCVQSLGTKTKTAVSTVFGKEHIHFKWLFEQSSGGDISLSKLRSELAHGDVTLLDKAHEHLVRKHLHEMGDITKEFLMRILFRLNPSQAVPSWSKTFQVSVTTADPRSTLFSTTDSIFPSGASWKIRPEWCE
jgi:hypothetical protein